MLKSEALKLAIDGVKVRRNEWPQNAYLYFDREGLCFIAESKESVELLVFAQDGWEFYMEPMFDAHAYILARCFK